MKTLIALSLFLLAAPAFAAIEFSEDQVAPTAQTMASSDAAAATSGTAGGNGLKMVGNTGPTNGAAAMQMASVAATMDSSGGVVSNPGSGFAVANGGGGNGVNGAADDDADAQPLENDDQLVLDSDGNLVCAFEEVADGADSGAAADAASAEEAGAIAMPEPSTMVVWLVLSVCGLVFVRRNQR